MTLSPPQRPAIVRASDMRETSKPAWRTPVCRPVTLPAATLAFGFGSLDGETES